MVSYNLFYKGFYKRFKDKTWKIFAVNLYKKRTLFLVDLLKKINDEYKISKSNTNSESSLLDLGCGIGDLTEKILELFNMNGVGIDIDKRFIEGRADFIVANSSVIPFKLNSFDLVTAISLIEHIPIANRKCFFQEISRVLTNDGILLLQIPNRYFPIEQHSFLPIVGYLPSRFHSLFYPSYVNVPSKKVIIKDLNKNGYDIVKIVEYGIPFSSFFQKNVLFKALPFGFIILARKSLS